MSHTLPTKPNCNDIPCRGLVPASIKTLSYFFHHEIQFFPIVTDPNTQRLGFRVYAIVRPNCGRTGNFFCLVVKQQSGVNRPWEGLFNINATKLPADPSRYTIETTTFKPAPSDLLAYFEEHHPCPPMALSRRLQAAVDPATPLDSVDDQDTGSSTASSRRRTAGASGNLIGLVDEDEGDASEEEERGVIGEVDRRSTRSGTTRRRVEHNGSSGDEENHTSTAGRRHTRKSAETGPSRKRHKDDEEHHSNEAAGAGTREVQVFYEEKKHQRLLAAVRLEAAAVEAKEARMIQRDES